MAIAGGPAKSRRIVGIGVGDGDKNFKAFNEPFAGSQAKRAGLLSQRFGSGNQQLDAFGVPPGNGPANGG